MKTHFLLPVALVSLAVYGLAPDVAAQETFAVLDQEYRLSDGRWYHFQDGRRTDPALLSQIVVRLNGGEEPSTFDFDRVGGIGGIEINPRRISGGYYVLRLDESRDPFSLITALASDSAIEYVAFDALGRLHSVTPDDPLFGTRVNCGAGIGQWNLRKIRMPEAWPISAGHPGIVTAILDTEMDYYHQDLVGNVWTNAIECPGGWGTCTENGVDDDGNGFVDDFVGWDFDQNDNEPGAGPLQGPRGHGSATAGIAMARSDNAEGVAGIAGGWDNETGSLMMSVKFDTTCFDCGEIPQTSVANGIDYAVANGPM